MDGLRWRFTVGQFAVGGLGSAVCRLRFCGFCRRFVVYGWRFVINGFRLAFAVCGLLLAVCNLQFNTYWCIYFVGRFSIDLTHSFAPLQNKYCELKIL